MGSGSKTMLFGGALLCAGMHATPIQAQVSAALFRFDGNVNNIFEFDGYDSFGYPQYIDTGVNESFDIQGDAGILPFSRSAMGGFEGAPGSYAYFPETRASSSGDGSLSPSGELWFSGSSSASAGVSFPATPDFDVNSTVEVSFSVDVPTEYEVAVTSFFFDNDVGSAGVRLRTASGDTIFEYFGVFFDPIGSGTLEPGEYVFSIDSAGAGSASANLNVVPAPATAALLGLGGGLAARRRR